MLITYLNNIEDYKKFLDVDEETYIYVKDLTHRGISILDEMKENKKLYVGKMTRHVKDNWFNYNICGAEAPEINEYQWKNVKMRSYEPLLGDKDYTEEQIVDALSYIYTNFPGTYGSLPRSPSSIVEHAMNVNKYMNCSNPIVIDFAHNAFQPGAVHILPQNINKKIKYETHLDIHQAYASIMSRNIFPVGDADYILSETATDEEFNFLFELPSIIHICGGKVRLKATGFPLLQQSIKQKAASLSKWSRGTMTLSNYDEIYDIAELYDGIYLTSPAYQVLLENYEIVEPLQILDGVVWKETKQGIGANFIAKIYDLRMTTTNPALKSFAKLCNEYCAGMFQRKVIAEENAWIDLEGNKQKNSIKRKRLNCAIGDFITDYLRLEISHLLQKLPHDWIIGYDTDGIFINQPVENIEPLVEDILGDTPGFCHFDGIYRDVIHLANKQYYGYTIDGKIFGKLAGVIDGTKVAEQLLSGVPEDEIFTTNYVWNKSIKNYVLAETKAKIGGRIDG